MTSTLVITVKGLMVDMPRTDCLTYTSVYGIRYSSWVLVYVESCEEESKKSCCMMGAGICDFETKQMSTCTVTLVSFSGFVSICSMGMRLQFHCPHVRFVTFIVNSKTLTNGNYLQ